MATYKFVNIFKNKHHGGSRSLSALRGIVIHYTYGNNGGDRSILVDGKGREVSVHYFVPDDDDKGATTNDRIQIIRCLPLKTVGWSVGAAISGWGNTQTVSIEVSNRGNERPTIAQLERVDAIIADIDHQVGRKLPIKGHYEVAVPKGRKAGDPNSTFPLVNYKKYRKHLKPVTKGIKKVVKAVKAVVRPAQPCIHQGNHGSAVVLLQKELTKRGFLLAADGDFGPATVKQVKRYQKAHKLAQDGIVCKQTWRALGYKVK